MNILTWLVVLEKKMMILNIGSFSTKVQAYSVNDKFSYKEKTTFNYFYLYNMLHT